MSVHDIAVVGVVTALVVGATVALLLTPRLFAPGARISVDNQTPYVTRIGITDADIGCGDSELVGPDLNRSVDLSLHGPILDTMLGILCLGDPISTVGISNSAGEWMCAWNEARSRGTIVITEDGPNCHVIGKRISPTPTVP